MTTLIYSCTLRIGLLLNNFIQEVMDSPKPPTIKTLNENEIESKAFSKSISNSYPGILCSSVR